MGISRRQLLIGTAAGAVSAAIPKRSSGSRADDPFAQAHLLALDFAKKYDVPGMSISIARDEKLVFEAGFGYADISAKRDVTPASLFRIASVSKPITSVALFRIIEKGRLHLSDLVFGEGGVLAAEFGSPKLSDGVRSITIEHLMTHTCGGWQNDGNDPMFHNTELNHHDLIATTILNHPLIHVPGEKFAYSNFGYCVLGRVLEKLTREPYAASVQDLVLHPCGITDMRITGNTRDDRAPNEVVYYDAEADAPYGMPSSRMDSHGGWLARPTDLVMFLTRVDEFPKRADILKSETIDTMITGTKAAAGYGHGWMVNVKGRNYFHNGSLPGTCSIAVRTQGGYCWAAITNVRRPGTHMDGDLDQLMWKMVDSVKAWPEIDLFKRS